MRELPGQRCEGKEWAGLEGELLAAQTVLGAVLSV